MMLSAGYYTDHRLARCKVAFTFKSLPKRKCPRTKKHTFRNPRVKNNFQVMLEERLCCVTAADPEDEDHTTGNYG